jgi:hypothetical protein
VLAQTFRRNRQKVSSRYDTRAEMAKEARVSHDTIAKGKVIVAEVLRPGTVRNAATQVPTAFTTSALNSVFGP